MINSNMNTTSMNDKVKSSARTDSRLSVAVDTSDDIIADIMLLISGENGLMNRVHHIVGDERGDGEEADIGICGKGAEMGKGGINISQLIELNNNKLRNIARDLAYIINII